MKRILCFVFCVLSFAYMQAQCEKVNSAGVELILDAMPNAKIPNQIRISLKNATEEARSFCWHDLENTWGLPLAFDLTVIDENNNPVHNRFNWSKHFSAAAFDNYKKKSELIVLEPGKVYSKEVILYWPKMLPGTYKIQLISVEKPEISSNEITMIVN